MSNKQRNFKIRYFIGVAIATIIISIYGMIVGVPKLNILVGFIFVSFIAIVYYFWKWIESRMRQ